MAKLFTIDQPASRIYAHEGFSASVYASLSLTAGLGAGTFGVAVDGTTLVHCDDTNTYVHAAGWTASISSQFANAYANQRDLYWDGTNLQAGAINGGVGRCIKYTGKTATVLATFVDSIGDGHMKSCNQIAGAGNTQTSTGDITRSFQLYSGFTGTRVSSFNVAQVLGNHGGETDGTNYLAVLTLSDLSTWVYKLSGFTSTVTAGFVAPTANIRGVTWSPSAFDATFKSTTAAAVLNSTAAGFINVPFVTWVPVATASLAVVVLAAVPTISVFDLPIYGRVQAAASIGPRVLALPSFSPRVSASSAVGPKDDGSASLE